MFRGLVLFLKHKYIVVIYGVGCVLGELFFLFVYLEHTQLCTLPGDSWGLHLTAWGWDHFHRAWKWVLCVTLFRIEPLSLITEESVEAQMGRLSRS